jgi:SAM-dependent methyltransferase
MYCIEKSYPEWRSKIIHESSPVNRGASVKLKKHAENYIASQFFPDVELGAIYNNIRCENLERLTFEDNSIDLHITQDVMEHVFDADLVFKEIARTLRPGGSHIFTVPIVNKHKPTELCARTTSDGSVEFLREPEYHGNPVSDQGSLVIRRWGYDICDFIFKSSGLFTQTIIIDALELGIRAELIEVLITRKPAF